jgi:hypothetical protein
MRKDLLPPSGSDSFPVAEGGRNGDFDSMHRQAEPRRAHPPSDLWVGAGISAPVPVETRRVTSFAARRVLSSFKQQAARQPMTWPLLGTFG